MSTPSNGNKTPLLQYWTTRYVATLLVGLLVIGLVSAFWIQRTTLQNRLDLTKLLAEETADRVIDSEGTIIFGTVLSRVLDERQRMLNLDTEMVTAVLDNEGSVLFSKPQQAFTRRAAPFPPGLLNSGDDTQKISLDDGGKVYLVKAPIEFNGVTAGWVVILQSERDLERVNQEFGLLAVMLASLGILGWLVIYFLSRKLSQPIKEVAEAAKQIEDGDYHVSLPEEAAGREVHELIQSFKEMSQRLGQLEKMRAELLASVTHELKTPVASISGINQALNDGVVEGEEAKELLEIALKEGKRLEAMIKDLLDFNSFAAGAVTLLPDTYNLYSLVSEITHQWRIPQENKELRVEVEGAGRDLLVRTDGARLQQILINLLNNSVQAMDGTGQIRISLKEDETGTALIEVRDNGPGIPGKEQDLIFERFYRGEGKKHKIRGLGIGLPYSRMLARAMEGDLLLKESNEQGTTFLLKLPLADEGMDMS